MIALPIHFWSNGINLWSDWFWYRLVTLEQRHRIRRMVSSISSTSSWPVHFLVVIKRGLEIRPCAESHMFSTPKYLIFWVENATPTFGASNVIEICLLSFANSRTIASHSWDIWKQTCLNEMADLIGIGECVVKRIYEEILPNGSIQLIPYFSSHPQIERLFGWYQKVDWQWSRFLLHEA